MPVADQLPVMDLPLESIVIDGDTQARVEVPSDTVDRYGECLDAGDEFPPVDVFGPDGDRYWMGDGFSRFLSHEQKGKPTIKARVHPGGKREALAHAIGANATHGLPRTAADKRRAVELILADPEWSKLSTELVAGMAKVHWHTANKVRGEWEAANGTPATRTGADGIAHPARLAEPPPVAALIEPPDAVADETIEQPAEQTPDESETLKPRARESDADATSSPPLKVPGRVVTDAWGVPVPDHLLPVWESATKLREMVKAVQKVKVDFAALRGQKGTEKFSAASQNTLTAHIDNAVALLKAGMPFVVCPDCNGDCCDGQANSTCEARGWLCRERYERCTKRQRSNAERYKHTTAG